MRRIISIAAVAMMLASPLSSLAQATQQDETRRIPAAKGTSSDNPAVGAQYGQGGSPHCDSLTGTEKDQCLKDEGAKTDSNGPADSAAGGATGPVRKGPPAGGPDDAEHAPTK